jgi:hypothetical protein
MEMLVGHRKVAAIERLGIIEKVAAIERLGV